MTVDLSNREMINSKDLKFWLKNKLNNSDVLITDKVTPGLILSAVNASLIFNSYTINKYPNSLKISKLISHYFKKS